MIRLSIIIDPRSRPPFYRGRRNYLPKRSFPSQLSSRWTSIYRRTAVASVDIRIDECKRREIPRLPLSRRDRIVIRAIIGRLRTGRFTRARARVCRYSPLVA